MAAALGESGKLQSRTMRLLAVWLLFVFVFMNLHMSSVSGEEAVKEIELYIGSNTAIVDGTRLQIDKNDTSRVPYFKREKTFVPLRFVAEHYGASVAWEEATQTAVITQGQRKLRIVPGQPEMTVGNEHLPLPEPAEFKGDSIHVPLRALSEAMGFKVNFAHNLIVITNVDKPSSLDTVWSKDGQVLKSGMAYAVFQHDVFLDGFESDKEAIAYAKLWNHSSVRLRDGNPIWDFEKYAAEQAAEAERKRKEAERKPVYLTFDDGPGPYTAALLDLLKQGDDKATFFMLSGRIQSQPDVAKRMVEEGHAIGMHGVTHDVKKVYRSPQSLVDEMNACNDALEAATGLRSVLIRVPYGSKPHAPKPFRDATSAAGYHMWDWNVDSYDSRSGSTSESIVRETIQQLERKGSGAVILFHDTRKPTLDAIPEILNYLHEHGYASRALTADLTPINFWGDTR